MPGKKAPKVAYAVFVGRKPGVYSTWGEADKQVKGFSRAVLRGYTVEDGGRARAENDFREFGRKKAKEHEVGHTRRFEGTNTESTPCDEPIRVHPGYVARTLASRHCVAEQLRTPPNTLTGKKKARPPSWEFENELRKKAVCVDNGRIGKGNMGLQSGHSHIHITPHTPLSATISFCDAEDCSIEDSGSTDEEPLNPVHSDVVANDNSSDDRSSNDYVFGSTRSDGNSVVGEYVEEADISCQMSLAADTEQNCGASTLASTTPLHDCVGEVDVASEVVYPQLPMPKTSECADALELAPDHHSNAADLPNISADQFDPAEYVDVADLGCLIPFATDSEDDGAASAIASPILLHDCVSEVDVASEVAYPQLPMPKTSECADALELASNDHSIAADHFDPALDYIALDVSSDYGDFLDDVAVPDRVSANGPRTEPRLCAEQLALAGLVESGRNVFYTGSAGSGKSAVLKHMVSMLRREGKKVVVLAPTARAAIGVNGRTLHSYAGWAPHSLRQPLGELKNNARGEEVQKRLGATDVLIIDEISMVSNDLFERLSCVMKSARHRKEPFGGVQIIATGDFCQLPPVNPFEYCLMCGTGLGHATCEGIYECDNCSAEFDEIDKWAFCSTAWQECDFEYVNLSVIHRQKDATLKALLEKCRFGQPFSVDEKWLLLDHASETKDAVRLFPRRVDVKEINDKEFALLPGRALTYLCLDNFYWNSEHRTLRKKRVHCPEPMSHALEALEDHALEPKLALKEGMLVMLLVNWDLDSSLANGSQGTIVGFEKHDPEWFPQVPEEWDYSSRRNGLVRVFVGRQAVREWPIVQFHNGRKRTIYPRCMMNELGDDEPYSLLSRTQIPLTAAWAMTVHKAQGMTMSRVIVDLRHSFEPGQEYVALSRAETLAGLKVEGLPKESRGPNAQVIDFMKANGLMPDINLDPCGDAKSEEAKGAG